MSPDRALRNISFLFIFAIAAFIGWMWFQPVCAGGAIVKDEAACRAAAGFDAAFCRDVFSRTAKIAFEVGPSYVSEQECRDKWPVCDPHAPAGFQWGARPSSWCVVRAAGGPARIDPQYDVRG